MVIAYQDVWRILYGKKKGKRVEQANTRYWQQDGGIEISSSGKNTSHHGDVIIFIKVHRHVIFSRVHIIVSQLMIVWI